MSPTSSPSISAANSDHAQGRPLVLVTGSPRSGTTWVGDVLQRSPGMMLLTEPFNPDLSQRPWRVCNIRFHEWFIYVTDDNAHIYERPIRRMLELKHDTIDRLRASRNWKDVVDVTARAARFRLSRFTTHGSIMKDPLALASSEWLARRFGAKVVVLIRHPAAIVSSYKRLNLCVDIRGLLRQPLLLRDLLGPMEEELRDFVKPAVEPDIVDQAAMLWKALHFMILEFQRRHPDWLFVRHEDLSKDTAGGFEKICEHVGLPYTENVRRFAIESNDERLPPELGVQDAFTTRRNAALNLTNWKSRLTGEEIARIRDRVEGVANDFYRDEEWK
jgi:hypothetical protein